MSDVGDALLCEPMGRLAAQFPEVTAADVSAVLHAASCTVRAVTGQALPDKIEQLARLRLEIRFGHPAIGLPAD